MTQQFIKDLYRLRINVFLSSTYTDLKVERENISFSLKRLRWPQVQWMEGELSQDVPILKRCLEMVEDSHIYIGLIGSRSGTMLEDDKGLLSMTEREFDHATNLHLYRMVFISESRKSDEDPALMAFKQKIQNSLWPDYFRSKDHLTANVSLALSHIWNELNGRMHVVAFRPWTDFATTDPLVELRTCIANDCGIEPSKVWLTSLDAPIPEVTQFIALLPNIYKNKYLQLGPKIWSGSVIHASHYEPDTPFLNSELFNLYASLRRIIKGLASQAERYQAVKKWISSQHGM